MASVSPCQLIIKLIVWNFCLFQYGYKMLDDFATTQDEMDRIAFSLDKNRFPKAASFSAGQKSEPSTVQVGKKTKCFSFSFRRR